MRPILEYSTKKEQLSKSKIRIATNQNEVVLKWNFTACCQNQPCCTKWCYSLM